MACTKSSQGITTEGFAVLMALTILLGRSTPVRAKAALGPRSWCLTRLVRCGWARLQCALAPEHGHCPSPGAVGIYWSMIK